MGLTMMNLRILVKKKIIYSCIIILIFTVFNSYLFSQISTTKKTNTHKVLVFPDEYSRLDDINASKTEDNEILLKTLERSRQKYLQALILIDKADTSRAAKYFEQAINILNRVVSYPGIENNRDFTDLAQSIIDDYESNIQSIEELSDDSPFFLVRNKLFDEVDTYDSVRVPRLNIIRVTQDTATSIVGNESIISQPKKVVIPLDDNDEVNKNIAFLTADGRKGGKRFFKKWLERSTKWLPMMRRIAAEEKMPEELIYLAMIESGLRPNAVSSAKAVGLWQFIRSTGELYGLNDTASVWVDERRDPEKSTRAAFQHLRDLHETFNDWHLALAAYNCGTGRVSRTLMTADSNDTTYWSIRRKLPRETQHYVPIFIAATKIALNPEAYGFNLDSLNYDDDYAYDSYVLNETLTLSAIAKCVDTTREAIQELNPELIRSITPPDKKSYTIKLPKNTKKLFVANYSLLTSEEKQPWVEHKVKRRESLSKIARIYGLSRKEIAIANNMKSVKSRLRRGEILKIPIDKDYYLQKKKEKEDNNLLIVSQKKKTKNNVIHKVKKGETLYSIANKYSIRMVDLRNLNNIPYDDDNLKIGQKLIIASGKNIAHTKKSSNLKSSGKKYRHKVKKGETLASIALKYHSTASSIKKLNNLKSDKIIIGQTLVVNSRLASNRNVKSTLKLTHKVKKGETLSTIASIYGVTESNLKKWNPKKISGNTVFLGSTLKVRRPHISKGSSRPIKKKVNRSPKYYRVRSGDTFSSIAHKFGVSLKTLKAKNKGIKIDKLKIRQKIRIQ